MKTEYIDYLTTLDISGQSFRILLALNIKEHTQTQIQEKLNIQDKAQVNKLFKDLSNRGLIEISDFRNKNYKFLLPFLPIAGLFITWMYHKFNELSLKGMTLVFETRQQKRNSIPLALVPLVMVGTWITHLFGGSAGREGVAVQIGATLSHYMGRKVKNS